MNKVVIVGGPTASGKTKLAVEIAKKFNGELINADSRQIYKYLDIGTNKGESSVTSNQLSVKTNNNLKYWKLATGNWLLDNIPIHLLSFLDPDQRFSVFEYKELAQKVIDDILERGKLPIMVGGTGLYIDALVKNYELPARNATHSVAGGQVTNYEDTDSFRRYLESLSLAELQKELSALDSRLFTQLNNSDRNNPRRLVRLIEKEKGENRDWRPETACLPARQGDWRPNTYNLKPTTSKDQRPTTNVPSNNQHNVSLFLYPQYNWHELKQKIESRVDQMFNDGLVEETKKVLEMGFQKNSVALQGIGYKEVVKYLDGEINLDKCIELVKISHKQYARRQRTWFEGERRGYDLKRISSFSEAKKYLHKFLK